MDFFSNDDRFGYRVEVDFHDIDENTLNDSDTPTAELQPVKSCSLTPGVPSPMGLNADGELVYPVHRGSCWAEFDRADLARLANAWAKDQGITAVPEHPYATPASYLLGKLLSEAMPRQFFGADNHGEMAHRAALQAVIDGDLAPLDPLWAER